MCIRNLITYWVLYRISGIYTLQDTTVCVSAIGAVLMNGTCMVMLG